MSIKRFNGAGISGTKSIKLWDQVTTQNDFQSIATVVVTGSASTVVFSGIPANYTHLQVRVSARSQGGPNGTFNLQLSGDGTTAYGYGFHFFKGDGSSASAGHTGSGSQTSIQLPWISSSSETTGVFSGVVIDILDYANLSKNKVIRSIGGFDNNGSGSAAITSGIWLSNSAVTSLTFASSVSPYTFAVGTQFSLYGIKVSG